MTFTWLRFSGRKIYEFVDCLKGHMVPFLNYNWKWRRPHIDRHFLHYLKEAQASVCQHVYWCLRAKKRRKPEADGCLTQLNHWSTECQVSARGTLIFRWSCVALCLFCVPWVHSKCFVSTYWNTGNLLWCDARRVSVCVRVRDQIMARVVSDLSVWDLRAAAF